MCLSSFVAEKLDIPVSQIRESKLVLRKEIIGQSFYDDERRLLDDEGIVSKIDTSGNAILQIRKGEALSLLVYYIQGTVFAIIEVYSKTKQADTLEGFNIEGKKPN